MTETASSILAPWSNFYVMIGSSAAALTGLMFVVITLVSGEERVRRAPDGVSTFSTPTVVHFSAALFVAAILSAPWHVLAQPAALLAIAGLSGVVYVLRVMARARQLSTYRPDLEDWVWYTVLPLVGYGAMLTAAMLLFAVPSDGMFVLAGAVMLLIFLGIRNSWDVVTYIAIRDPGSEEPPSSG